MNYLLWVLDDYILRNLYDLIFFLFLYYVEQTFMKIQLEVKIFG